MNECYWIITLIVSFSGVLLFYKLFGRVGLFSWIILATIVTNIQTVKLVDLFGIEMSLGTILYGTTFIATDILNEKYGRKCAKQSIYLGLLGMGAMTLLMILSLLYKPSANDFASDALSLIFTFNVRITFASLISYFCSQLVDTAIYQFLKKKYRSLWVRNNGSTIISQLLDTILFVTITYAGTVPITSLFSIGIWMYVFKFIIALLDTPFMYLAMRIKNKEVSCE